MTDAHDRPKPDLTAGVPLSDIPDRGMLLGHIGDEDVVVARRGEELFAVGAYCTHYHGPLAEGLLVEGTVRCPWHHACFNLRTGKAVRAPALDYLACWRVERVGDSVVVRQKVAASEAARPSAAASHVVGPIVVVGGGAAGLAAADVLRREGYQGPLTLISADDSPPCDRPNLSKDFLAGTAEDSWIPLRPPEYYTDRRIDLRLGSPVSALELDQKRVRLRDGTTCEFAVLLIATGADPIRLSIPGAAAVPVHYRRTFADSGPSSPARRRRRARWSWARASSAWRSRPRCARGVSRSTS
jgi:nitrite reductase/ring-hydroxylating ferredoxin subunit